MSKDLSEITIDDFVELVGETFKIGEHEAELLEVTNKENGDRPPRFRQPFSLLFKTPDDCSISSVVVPVSHPAIGSHNILVSQVLGWEDESNLEICLS